MKKYVFLIVLFVFCGFVCGSLLLNSRELCFAVGGFPLPDATISASCSGASAFAFDADSGRVFYQKNAQQKRAMASTTKIATAITVIRNCDNLDEEVKISAESVGVEGTSIYLREGEVLTVRELLYGLMLRSGNDSATALAYHCAGSLEEFAKLMNETAVLAGATNTNFVNPHGLDDPSHYTTAQDLAKITALALQNDDFRQIVSTKNIKITGNSEEAYRFLANKNRLLGSLPGCIGVKTGYTSKAGRCLVSACERDGLRVVCVVLNCGPMFEESADIINSIYEKYASFEILAPYNVVGSIPLLNGDVASIQVYSRNGLKLALSQEEFSQITVEYDLPETLNAPIKVDEPVGKVQVYFGKHLIFDEKIYTIDEVDSKLLRDKMRDILKKWSVLD